MVKQANGVMTFPKGPIHRGEEILSAAHRAIYEETGINRLELIKVLGHYYRYRIGVKGGEDSSEYKKICMFFFTTDQEHIKPLSPEITEALWVDMEEVASLLTHVKDKQFFQKVEDKVASLWQQEKRFPSPKRVVTFHYTLFDQNGNTIESSSGSRPVSCLEGSDQVVPGLARNLFTLKKDDQKRIIVRAYEAYGYRDEELVNRIPLTMIPIKVSIGDILEVQGDDGIPQKVTATAKTLHDVTLDGNHPLAGQDLVFEVQVLDVRSATSGELIMIQSHKENSDNK